jgi:hypothetical protein
MYLQCQYNFLLTFIIYPHTLYSTPQRAGINQLIEVKMTYYQTIDGREAIHIGYNPEVGKETFRVGKELVFADADGSIAGLPFIEKREGTVLVLFHGGTWREYSDKTTYELETSGQDIYQEVWLINESDN